MSEIKFPKFDRNKHFWGNPCKHNHISPEGESLRFIRNGICVLCEAGYRTKKVKTSPDRTPTPPSKAAKVVTSKEIQEFKERQCADRRTDRLQKIREHGSTPNEFKP